MKTRRRKARRLALQILYEMDCSGHEMESTFAYLGEDIDLENDRKDFALELVRGAWGHRATPRRAASWRTGRGATPRVALACTPRRGAGTCR